LIIQAWQNCPHAIMALPLVGDGSAYRKVAIPVIGPKAELPSGGMIYTHIRFLWQDLRSGLIGVTLRQIQTALQFGRRCHGIVAVGDIFPVALAWLTRRPFVAFLVSTSSYYEGRLQLPWLTRFCLRSPRCLGILTRDRFTAEDLQHQGFSHSLFAGYPIMDTLQPTGQPLDLAPHLATVALLPGSRLPEALHNLALLLRVCKAIALYQPMQYRVALVRAIQESDLQALAEREGWHYESLGILRRQVGTKSLEVQCYWGAFADILHTCQIVVGMAGTAIEQAVGLGKPVIQISGTGPQFTYAFAEAQMRLLGCSVQTIDRRSSERDRCAQAAQVVLRTLQDQAYLDKCGDNGRERVGLAGGSVAIAQRLDQYFRA
jgi:uncharacterized protein (TIGR03492 family)